MENQGENSAVIGALFGPDESSPLFFSSNVDVAGMAFSFSLKPGSTYLGLAITLSGSGVFDAVTDVWNASSSVTLGSASWTVTGTYGGNPATDDSFLPPPFLPVSNFVIDPGSRQYHDIHDLIFYNPATGESGGFFHFTDIHGIRSTPNFPITDHRNQDGTWSWDTITDTFRIDSTGISLEGDGSFSTTISAIPEPSSVVLFGAGLLGMMIRGWRRLHSLRPVSSTEK